MLVSWIPSVIFGYSETGPKRPSRTYGLRRTAGCTFPPRRLPGPVVDGGPPHHIRERYAVTRGLRRLHQILPLSSNGRGGETVCMEISNTSEMLAGVILVTVPTIEYGGSFLLGMLRRAETAYVDNALRHDLFRAGHAHAGVLVLLSLICQLLADVAILPARLIWIARLGAPCAAILMSLGFFLSAASPRVTEPTRIISLVYTGAVILGMAILAVGVGLIRAGVRG